MIEISRTQDEEVGDGTTSVIILGTTNAHTHTHTHSNTHTHSLAAGEMLSVAEPFLEQQMHPTVIIRAFRQALDDILSICKDEIGWAESHTPCGCGFVQPLSRHCLLSKR